MQRTNTTTHTTRTSEELEAIAEAEIDARIARDELAADAEAAAREEEMNADPCLDAEMRPTTNRAKAMAAIEQARAAEQAAYEAGDARALSLIVMDRTRVTAVTRRAEDFIRETWEEYPNARFTSYATQDPIYGFRAIRAREGVVAAARIGAESYSKSQIGHGRFYWIMAERSKQEKLGLLEAFKDYSSFFSEDEIEWCADTMQAHRHGRIAYMIEALGIEEEEVSSRLRSIDWSVYK